MNEGDEEGELLGESELGEDDGEELGAEDGEELGNDEGELEEDDEEFSPG